MKDETNVKAVAIIPSAGMGRRLGRKKTYLEIAGKPLIAHTLFAFEDSQLVSGVVLVVHGPDLKYCKEEILKRFGFKKPVALMPGGKERQDSVACALGVLDSDWDIVIVHDGARPLVTPGIIDETIRAALREGAAITAIEINDTVKEVTDGTVKRTVPRAKLRLVQTPQAFRFDLLKKAYQKALDDGFLGTDDSSLVERLGKKVKVVEGSCENMLGRGIG
jgi:2-C-methyl-D-erythritol 4-phosphate cytidylyltransferase